jgi:hypothetical protein
MNGKPSCFGKAQRAAMFCAHPELSKKDKDLLCFLATFWPNIWPGWPAIMAFSGITSQRGAQKQMSKLIQLGLIRCTNAGHIGRRQTAKYQICFEHSAFPDTTPSGERLTDSEDEKGEQTPGKSSSFLIQKDEQKQPDKAERVNGSAPKDEQFQEKGEQNPGKSSTQAFHKQSVSLHTSTQANLQKDKTAPGSRCGCVCVNLQTLNHVMAHVHRDMLGSQWKHGEKEQVQQLITEHGWETFLAVEKMYWQEQDPTAFARTIFKWTGLLTSFPGWLRKVTPEMLAELSEERWRATPAGAAEYQRMIDAAIAKDIEEHRRQAEATNNVIYSDEQKSERVVHAAVERCLAGEQVAAPEEMKVLDLDCWATIVSTDPITHTKTEVSVDESTGLLVARRL